MLAKLKKWLSGQAVAPPTTHQLGKVTADATRCVQCGVCGYNCPVGIDVRSYARQGLPVDAPTCITCGNCINVCPRGTLRWELADAAGVALTMFSAAAEQ